MSRNQCSSLILGYIAVSLFTATDAAATTIHVDSASQGIENGTREHPFRSIEPAIALSNPGDTIWIARGTYRPSGYMFVIKPGIAMIGEDNSTAIIDGIIADTADATTLPIALVDLSFDEFRFGRSICPGPFSGPNVVRHCVCNTIAIVHASSADTVTRENHSFVLEDNVVADEIRFAQGIGVGTGIVRRNHVGSIILASGAFWTYQIIDNIIDHVIADRSDSCWVTIARNTIVDGGIVDRSGGFEGREDAVIEDNVITCTGNPIDGEIPSHAVTLSGRSITCRNNTISSAIGGIVAKSGPPTNIIGNRILLPVLSPPFTQGDSAIIGIESKAGAGVVTGNVITGGYLGYYSLAGTTLFEGNSITGAHTGFFSRGFERVRDNTISNCSGDGMILAGLRGPIERNRIENNGGAGIRVIRYPIDLGGGADTSIGENTLRGNGDFDLRLGVSGTDTGTLYARNNYWDHATHEEIAAFDIFDDEDADSLPHVEFTPFAVSGVIHDDEIASSLRLMVAPNPAVTWTTITYRLENSSGVSLRLFDVLGNEVERILDDWKSSGEHSTSLTLREASSGRLPSGVYYVMLTADGRSDVRSILVR